MRNRMGAGLMSASCRLFTFIMPLYPVALRNQFGPDMVDVFEQQIRDESARRGFIGVARVWVGIASDVVQSSVPDEISWRRVLIPAISVAGSFLLFAIFFVASHLATRCIK